MVEYRTHKNENYRVHWEYVMVRVLWWSGMSTYDISRFTGLSQSTVHRGVRGDNWKGLLHPPPSVVLDDDAHEECPYCLLSSCIDEDNFGDRWRILYRDDDIIVGYDGEDEEGRPYPVWACRREHGDNCSYSSWRDMVGMLREMVLDTWETDDCVYVHLPEVTPRDPAHRFNMRRSGYRPREMGHVVSYAVLAGYMPSGVVGELVPREVDSVIARAFKQ